MCIAIPVLEQPISSRRHGSIHGQAHKFLLSLLLLGSISIASESSRDLRPRIDMASNNVESRPASRKINKSKRLRLSDEVGWVRGGSLGDTPVNVNQIRQTAADGGDPCHPCHTILSPALTQMWSARLSARRGVPGLPENCVYVPTWVSVLLHPSSHRIHDSLSAVDASHNQSQKPGHCNML